MVKNPPANTGDTRDLDSIPPSGRFPHRRRCHPTPVLLSGKSHGQWSLAGCGPWGHKELDTSQHTHTDPRSPGQSLILTDISFILSEILYVYFHLHSFSCTFSVFSICPHFFLLYPKMLLL